MPPDKPKGRGRRVFGVVLVVFGVLPLLGGSLTIVKNFSNAQQLVPNEKFVPVAWHNLSSEQIFPDHVDGWSRQGIAEESTCEEAFRSDLAELAAGHGCVTALRATYVDASATTAVTLGVGVVNSPQASAAIGTEFDWAANPGPLVWPYAVPDTPAAEWNEDLALSGGAANLDFLGYEGPGTSYFVAITAGPLDGRRSYAELPEPWAMEGEPEKQVYWLMGSHLLTRYGSTFREVVRGG